MMKHKWIHAGYMIGASMVLSDVLNTHADTEPSVDLEEVDGWTRVDVHELKKNQR